MGCLAYEMPNEIAVGKKNSAFVTFQCYFWWQLISKNRQTELIYTGQSGVNKMTRQRNKTKDKR